jgi:hypothetical protein
MKIRTTSPQKGKSSQADAVDARPVPRDRSYPESIGEAIAALLRYCQSNDWAGYDPYDALNSRVFRKTPFFRNKFCRLIFTQGMKRCPVNLRPLFGIPKEKNPKALALFATALLKLPNKESTAKSSLDILLQNKSENYPYICWGYNFDWQNRVALVPRGEPNIICTTFAGNAFLDAYEKYHDQRYLEVALSAAEFLLRGLNILRHGTEICFSYTSRDHSKIHNANLLGAAFLARLYQFVGDESLMQYAISAAKFTVVRQAPDGSWPYGEAPSQKWIDNFHTGFNLVALKRLGKIASRTDFKQSVERGFEFYRKNFFQNDGRVKYYHNQTYPIDIHAIAQSIITLVELGELRDDSLSLARVVCQWAWDHMRNPAGYYYYQQGRFVTKKISYMRWSQAWMLLALATLAAGLSDQN